MYVLPQMERVCIPSHKSLWINSLGLCVLLSYCFEIVVLVIIFFMQVWHTLLMETYYSLIGYKIPVLLMRIVQRFKYPHQQWQSMSSPSFCTASWVAIATITRNTPLYFLALKATSLFFIAQHQSLSIMTFALFIAHAILRENKLSFNLKTFTSFNTLMFREMIACPQCIALRLCLSPTATMVGTPNGSALIN